MDTENKFNLPRTPFEKILLSIIAILLSLIIIISSALILQNSYTERINDEDIVFSYTIYGNEIIAKINPLTDIKKLDFTINFTSKNDRYSKNSTIKKCKGTESLIATFWVDEISEKLNGEEPINISFSINKGFKKNESEYQTFDYNMCRFSFEYQSLDGDFPRQKEHKFTTTVTNTSNESIISIQNLNMTIKFNNNITCNIQEKRYDFEKPLKPGETKEIFVTYDSISFNFPRDFTDEQEEAFYKNKHSTTSYTNTYYSVVNGEKVIKSEYEKNKEQQNVRYTYTTVPVMVTNKDENR